MVIALINQKGGCGKSSTCFHLGGALAEQGLRVLLIDADPQGSLGQAFFGSAEIEQLPARETLTGRFTDLPVRADSLVRQTPFPGLEMICANSQLARYNSPEPHLSGRQPWVISQLLAELPSYDIVLIDCPPNLYQCSWNALLSADAVIVPVPPEDFGVQGLRAVNLAIEQAQLLNPQLQQVHYLMTRADRRLLVHRQYIEQLREFYGDRVLSTIVPEAVAFKLALTCRTPVTLQQPQSAAAVAIHELCAELRAVDSVTVPMAAEAR